MKIDNHASKHNGSTVELIKKTSPPKTNHVKKLVVIIKKKKVNSQKLLHHLLFNRGSEIISYINKLFENNGNIHEYVFFFHIEGL